MASISRSCSSSRSRIQLTKAKGGIVQSRPAASAAGDRSNPAPRALTSNNHPSTIAKPANANSKAVPDTKSASESSSAFSSPVEVESLRPCSSDPDDSTVRRRDLAAMVGQPRETVVTRLGSLRPFQPRCANPCASRPTCESHARQCSPDSPTAALRHDRSLPVQAACAHRGTAAPSASFRNDTLVWPSGVPESWRIHTLGDCRSADMVPTQGQAAGTNPCPGLSMTAAASQQSSPLNCAMPVRSAPLWTLAHAV